MSVTELVRNIEMQRSLGSSVSEGAIAAVSITSKAFPVEIHGVKLGVRDIDDPDTSQPNPIEIRYTQEFEIITHKTVGQKPLTQCTIPDGLWNIAIKFNVLKGSGDKSADADISKTLSDIKALKAGPGLLKTALFKEGLCTYITRKEIVQSEGADDWLHSVTLELIEANSGDI
mgnify:CR=1 FL=1